MYYKIDSEKLKQVTDIFNARYDESATDSLIESEICADWHNDTEHQAWIDATEPFEIAEWLASFVEWRD